MKITEYTPPDFLQNSDVETIHANMRANVSPDIDTSENSFFWDATRPVALEKAEIIQYKLNDVIMVCFPQWAYDYFLDFHAELRGLKRREPVKATGQVKFAGVPETIIPLGFKVSTPAVGDSASIEFYTTESKTIDESGIAILSVEASIPGIIGNVGARTIQLMVQPLQGITSVINENAITGGTEEEDDESLRERLLETGQTTPLSGADTDYIKWAKEVDGVGEAFVIPEWNGAGTVKVIIIDSNRVPANESLIDKVQKHIAPNVKNRGGLAPIGALVTVTAPRTRTLNLLFSWTLSKDANLADALNYLMKELNSYYVEVGVGGLIVYRKIGAKIINTPGVLDYSGLTINGHTDNIQLDEDEYPFTGTVEII